MQLDSSVGNVLSVTTASPTSSLLTTTLPSRLQGALPSNMSSFPPTQHLLQTSSAQHQPSIPTQTVQTSGLLQATSYAGYSTTAADNVTIRVTNAQTGANLAGMHAHLAKTLLYSETL